MEWIIEPVQYEQGTVHQVCPPFAIPCTNYGGCNPWACGCIMNVSGGYG